MRRRNMRLVIVGAVLIVGAVAFFVFMMGLAHKSNDPRAMMATVGQVSGVVTAIGLTMIGVGVIGKKV